MNDFHESTCDRTTVTLTSCKCGWVERLDAMPKGSPPGYVPMYVAEFAPREPLVDIDAVMADAKARAAAMPLSRVFDDR